MTVIRKLPVFSEKNNLKTIFISTLDKNIPNCSQYPNWLCIYKLSKFNLTKLRAYPFSSKIPITKLFRSGRFQIINQPVFLDFVRNLSLSLSLSLSPCLSRAIPVYIASFSTQPTLSYLKQTKLNLLGKHCNLLSKSVTFRRRILFTLQINRF